MGISTSHDAFNGSYTTYANFLRYITESLNGDYPMFGGEHPLCNINSHDKTWLPAEKIQSNPGIWFLLNYAYYSEEIEPINEHMCGVIASELEAITPIYEAYIDALAIAKNIENRYKDNFLTGWKITMQQFISGLREASKLGGLSYYV